MSKIRKEEITAKVFSIQDYKRLKSDENSKLFLSWNLHREISKINYKIHTDAIEDVMKWIFRIISFLIYTFEL